MAAKATPRLPQPIASLSWKSDSTACLKNLETCVAGWGGREACPMQGGSTRGLGFVGRAFGIPIALNPASRSQISKLILHVSDDEGKTWAHSIEVLPDEDHFTFSAPVEGHYWFTLCIVHKDGHREPADPFSVPPALKVEVVKA